MNHTHRRSLLVAVVAMTFAIGGCPRDAAAPAVAPAVTGTQQTPTEREHEGEHGPMGPMGPMGHGQAGTHAGMHDGPSGPSGQ